MNKTQALTLLSLCSVGALSSCQKPVPKQVHPNILFIMSDDHAYQAISAHGHGLNKTSNIDRIAREGAFTVFVPTATNSSIFTAMLTNGKYTIWKKTRKR
jgi:hypothetical protein